MENIVITFQYQRKMADLELPMDVPLATLSPIIVKELGWRMDEELSYSCRLLSTSQPLSLSQTLRASGVLQGDVVELRIQAPLPTAVSGPYLFSEDGQVYQWHGRSALIGRPDPPQPLPEIDLTPLDSGRRTSRRHAQIWQDHTKAFWLKDLRSSNGTFVNGRPVPAGQRQQLQHGDQIRFGAEGPSLIFYLGSADEP